MNLCFKRKRFFLATERGVFFFSLNDGVLKLQAFEIAKNVEKIENLDWKAWWLTFKQYGTNGQFRRSCRISEKYIFPKQRIVLSEKKLAERCYAKISKC